MTAYSVHLGDAYPRSDLNDVSMSDIPGKSYAANSLPSIGFNEASVFLSQDLFVNLYLGTTFPLEARPYQQEQHTNWDVHQSQTQAPSWMVGEGFDLQALSTWMASGFNSPLDVAGDIPWSLPPYGNDVASTNFGRQVQSSATQAAHEPAQQETPPTVSEIWFNRLNEKNVPGGQVETPTRATSPPLPQPSGPSAEPSEVDEVYRMRLSTQMKPKWSEEPLPSTEFLVSTSCT